MAMFRWAHYDDVDMSVKKDMSEMEWINIKSQICWICQAASTESNPVTIINTEPICDECLHEMAEISRSELESYWLKKLRNV